MDDDPGDPSAPVRVPVVRDGELDGPTATVGQSVQFRSGLVAEHGVGSSAKKRAPQLGTPWSRAGECCVDTSVHCLPTPVTYLISDPLNGQADLEGLTDGEYPILPIKQPKAFTRKLYRHGISMRIAKPTVKATPRTCG